MMPAGGGNGNATALAAEERLWTRVQQFAHEITHEEHYAALLSDSELPTVLVECLELLRVRPDAERLQQVISILLQMIEMPEQLNRNTARRHTQPSPHHAEMMEHARNWATDTLLDVHMTVTSTSGGGPIPELLNDKLSMQQLQTSLCTYAALNNSSHLVDEMQESIFTSFALQQMHLEDAAFAQVLDLCASSVLDDLEFALFVDAMLGSRDTFTVSRVFHDRLFRTESKALILAGGGSSSANGDPASQTGAPVPVQASRLFDQLNFISMVRVWGNHLPSWEAQLQEWLLQAHASPFVPMALVVWKYQEGVEPESASASFQSYSYLYTTMLNWFATKSNEFVASPRTMELLGFLSKLTRLSNDHRSHNRTLMHELGLNAGGETSSDTLTPIKRVHVFAKAELALQTLLLSTPSFDQQQSEAIASRLQYEWMGLAEHPHVLQGALELLFTTPNEAKEMERYAADSQQAQESRRGAAALIGWFYAFITTTNISSSTSNNNVSAKNIAVLTLELASSLDLEDFSKGSAFLQQKRAEFQCSTQLRIKIVWFWLLKCCFASADSIQNDAAVVDALESIEYAFRRFAPAKNKRSFQVEVVAQLLLDLEWRWEAVKHQQKAHASKGPQQTYMKELQERVDVPVAWLKKIVRLMQIEHQQHHQHRLPSTIAKAGAGALAHSEQLAIRLEHLFASGY